MSVLYIDIETLPQPEPVDPSEVEAPANYKDPEKIAAYQREHAREAWARTALDPLRGRIACVAWAVDDGPVRCMWALDGLPAVFDALLLVAGDERRVRDWCGYNLPSFDLRWLKLHALRLRHPLAGAMPYVKWDKRVVDVMDMYAGPDPRNRARQVDIARFLGLAVNTRPGSEVLSLYEAGRADEIMAHNVEDVEVVRELHRRIRG